MAGMRRSKPDTALLSKGKELLVLLEARDISALDELDAYVDEFDRWHKVWRERIHESPKDPELKGIGKEVASQHADILRLAAELKESIGTALKSLRRKGKGLIAYADHLPKRISTIRTRKG